MPPTLGFSIQLTGSEMIFRGLQATKRTRYLAYELHILFARLLAAVTRIVIAKRTPPVRDWDFYTLIRGEMIHGIRNR
ncbi:MAG: hypothetical protein WAO35_21740 [Terriglobia bacterium]